MSPRTTSAPTIVYQLKVTLRNFSPPIWRRIVVPSDVSLVDLHRIIQISMGWTNSHLHQYDVGGDYFGTPSPDDYYPINDETKAILSQIAPNEKDRFLYEYDFGDSWEHQILVEKILAADPKQRYPVCLKGKRACPPEDVGGVWGYANFLEAVADPNHPDHAELTEWYGDGFDPEYLDLAEINAGLARL